MMGSPEDYLLVPCRKARVTHVPGPAWHGDQRISNHFAEAQRFACSSHGLWVARPGEFQDDGVRINSGQQSTFD